MLNGGSKGACCTGSFEQTNLSNNSRKLESPMRSRFFLCVILAPSLAWHFSFSSSAAQQITSASLELRGTVINSATGEPVAPCPLDGTAYTYSNA